jgi:hypothetical protein
MEIPYRRFGTTYRFRVQGPRNCLIKPYLIFFSPQRPDRPWDPTSYIPKKGIFLSQDIVAGAWTSVKWATGVKMCGPNLFSSIRLLGVINLSTDTILRFLTTCSRAPFRKLLFAYPCYGLDGPGIFRPRPDQPWLPPSPYTMGTGSFPGVKRPGRDVDHSPHLAPRLRKE